VERFGRSRFGFGGVDPWVLFILSCLSYTGPTGALDQSDRCEPLVGFASGDLLDSCVLGRGVAGQFFVYLVLSR
jgi:hypothetical protein